MKVLYWLLALTSAPAQAVHPDWLQSYLDGSRQTFDNQQLAQNRDWFDCREFESQPVWCGEPFDYYGTQVWAQTVLAENNSSRVSATLILHARFRTHDWTQLQLGLRRDGLMLQRVRIGGQALDIREQLELRRPQEVNKNMVLFMNQNAGHFPKTQLWQSNHVVVKLHSDGQSIEITLRPAQASPLSDGAAKMLP